MAMKNRLTFAVLGVLTLGLGSGCSSVWQESYQPYAAAPSLPSGESAVVREIPWERMEAALREQEELLASSDVHWQEWDEDQRRDANTKLLKALQITEDPERVHLIGVSSFRTTDSVKPWDGDLASFAHKKGAHYAIWANRYMGKAETIVTRTVWSDSNDYISYEDGGGTNRRASRQRSSSADVPIVVEKDETGFTAFFLRVD